MVLRKRILADQLHNLLQIVFLLEDLLHLRLQDADVLGEGDVPIHRWEVFPLREFLVETPEDLHDAQRGRRHWICEVATRRRHRADDRDRAFASWTSKALHTATALVERGE